MYPGKRRTETEATMGTHQCEAGTQWTLKRESYPRVHLLCSTCSKEVQTIYLDDLDEDDLEYFTRVLKAHKKYRQENHGEE
jgi:hypothetical protein